MAFAIVLRCLGFVMSGNISGICSLLPGRVISATWRGHKSSLLLLPGKVQVLLVSAWQKHRSLHEKMHTR